MTEERIPASSAALLAHLSGEQLRRRILRGEIQAELVAGRWLVYRRSLDDYLVRQGQLEPQPAA
jgi:hypothetical protein